MKLQLAIIWKFHGHGIENIDPELFILLRAIREKGSLRSPEEFTHVAVAAMVASGAVDAGFGIKAAAGKFGLHFIPVVTETYVLAIDRQTPKPVITELKKILMSRIFKTSVNTMPGYNVKQAGEELAFADLFYEQNNWTI